MTTKLKQSDKLKLYELKKKNEGAAAGLSLLISGLGHFYIGEWIRGIVCLILQIGLWFILMGWVMWIITPIDAYQCAKIHNQILKIELGIE